MKFSVSGRLGAIYFALCLLFSAGASQAQVQSQSAGQPPISKESLFDFPAIKTLDGKLIPPNYWKGKVVVIERWASWCPFCNRQNPNVNALHKSFQAQGLEVLALSVDKEPQAALDYMSKKGYGFHAAMMSPELRARLGKTKTLPEIWVIGRDGRFKEYIPGEMFPEDVEDLASWLHK